MWFFRKRQDAPGTDTGQLVARLDALEARFGTLREQLKELEDTIARRMDKYRKRIERETEDGPSPPVNGLQTRPAFDTLSVRRGPRTFPGAGR
jgi:hypothetical protein